MDEVKDKPPAARCVVIGILQVNDHTEIRFVREPWGWRPDIVVNQATEEVSAPPPCFQPDDYAIAALDIAWARAKHESATGGRPL